MIKQLGRKNVENVYLFDLKLFYLTINSWIIFINYLIFNLNP